MSPQHSEVPGEYGNKLVSFYLKRARFLDDEQWDDWLACYAPSASFSCLHGMTTIP